MSDEWIVIRNWQKFQHYRDRTPPWIKVYVTELLHSEEYLSLPFATRGVLHGLWAHYALARGVVPAGTLGLSRALSGHVYRHQLERLNRAGFIELVASKPLALRALAREDPKGSSEEGAPEKGGAPDEDDGRRPADAAAPSGKNGVFFDVDLTPDPEGLRRIAEIQAAAQANADREKQQDEYVQSDEDLAEAFRRQEASREWLRQNRA